MQEKKRLPLEGIRVIELTSFVATPAAARVLCAYGAEVIKIEKPIGDEMRRAGHFERVVCEEDQNPLFTVVNAGKKLTGINLKKKGGRRTLEKLLEGADVFLSNIRMASLQKLDLGYEELHKKYPSLIYAHLSGYGLRGPDAALPGFDKTAYWVRTGPLTDWQLPGSFPFFPSYGYGDISTGTMLACGILMALLGRERTGNGTFVETSLYGNGIWNNSIAAVSHQPEFGGQQERDELHPADPFSYYYRCADGKWIAVFEHEYVQDRDTFAELFRLPQLREDARYATLEAMEETGVIVDLMRELNRQFLEKTSAEWMTILQGVNIPCEILRTARDICTDEQAYANGYLQKVAFRDGLTVPLPCPPLEFSEYSVNEITSAGKLGKDTLEVLQGLGLSQEEIKKLREEGAVF
jgi:crotonobetainyl-CoA:carnitine CoA-transferase CaiB-like acyl-CoA transferase